MSFLSGVTSLLGARAGDFGESFRAFWKSRQDWPTINIFPSRTSTLKKIECWHQLSMGVIIISWWVADQWGIDWHKIKICIIYKSPILRLHPCNAGYIKLVYTISVWLSFCLSVRLSVWNLSPSEPQNVEIWERCQKTQNKTMHLFRYIKRFFVLSFESSDSF